MISGANEEELELANARMDIMLATNYTPDNPGPLAIIDKYNDKEIDRLKNNWNELKKILEEQRDNPLNMEMKMFSNMVLNDMKYLETGEY